MPIVSLSAAFVRGASCVPARKKVDYFDASQRGFLLEVRQSGGKTYYQRYTDEHGRERQYKIGPADVLSLDRRAARENRLLLKPCSARIRSKGAAKCGRYRSLAGSCTSDICL